MANRSYLYTYHPGETPLYRDLSEWRSDVPISHLLLVGSNTTVCGSEIWDADQIALKGDAVPGRTLLLKFIDWLSPQISSTQFEEDAANTREYLARLDRQGSQFHLELAEIYQLSAIDDLEDMASATKENAQLAERLFLEVQKVISTPGSTVEDFNDFTLKKLKTNWEDDLGLHFTYVLYFHLGG
jgi:hypothetical protein